MASAVVDEALQCLDLVPKGYGALDDVKIGLKHMRTFLLFASKWHNEVRSKSDENTTSSSLMMMGSFLNKLEDSLIENGKNFHNPCLAQENTIRCSSLFDLFESGLFDSALKLGECIDSFRKEIAESYITLSDYYLLQSRDLSLEFFDSLQVNMADIRHGCSDEKDNIEVEPLQEKLLFFKNFIRFAQLRGFKPWQLQRLFTYLQVVAVNAARLCYEWTFLPYSGKTLLRDEFQFKFSELLLKINPVDPQIREIYVQVLMASKLSMSSVFKDSAESERDRSLAIRYRSDFTRRRRIQLFCSGLGLFFGDFGVNFGLFSGGVGANLGGVILVLMAAI